MFLSLINLIIMNFFLFATVSFLSDSFQFFPTSFALLIAEMVEDFTFLIPLRRSFRLLSLSPSPTIPTSSKQLWIIQLLSLVLAMTMASSSEGRENSGEDIISAMSGWALRNLRQNDIKVHIHVLRIPFFYNVRWEWKTGEKFIYIIPCHRKFIVFRKMGCGWLFIWIFGLLLYSNIQTPSYPQWVCQLHACRRRSIISIPKQTPLVAMNRDDGISATK